MFVAAQFYFARAAAMHCKNVEIRNKKVLLPEQSACGERWPSGGAAERAREFADRLGFRGRLSTVGR